MKSPWPLLTFLHCTDTGTESHLNAKPRWQKIDSVQCCFLQPLKTKGQLSSIAWNFFLDQLPRIASHHDQCCLAAASGCNHFMEPKVPTAFCHCNGFSSKKIALATSCIAKDHMFKNEVKPQLEHMKLDFATSRLQTKLALHRAIFLANFPYPLLAKSTKPTKWHYESDGHNN